MTWYYAVGSQQQGPVTEDQLQGLIKDGVVTGDTLVWREGMANWLPYRTVSGATPPPPAGCVRCRAGEHADPGLHPDGGSPLRGLLDSLLCQDA